MNCAVRTLLSFVFLGCMILIGAVAEAQSEKAGASALPEKTARGQEIFKQNCRICHDVYTRGAKMLVGPTLDGLFQRKTLIVGKPVNEANVKEVIQTGPTPGMPGFRYVLSDDEMDVLVEFLKTK